MLHPAIPLLIPVGDLPDVLLGSGSGICPTFCALLLGCFAIGVIRSIVNSPTPGRRVFLTLFLIVLLVGVGLMLWLAAIASWGDREAARRSQCTNHLKQIGLAMENYHDAYHCLPPAYIADEEDRPLYSWRVLLLPFMEQEQLYEQFHLDEPWNSPHNLTLLDGLPYRCFRCPSDDRDTEPTETNYVMIVGPNTISDGPSSRTFSEIRDGSSNTIAVVEVVDSGIRWAEPRDLRADEISFRINEPDRLGIGSRHPGGVEALVTDGSVRFISDKNAPGLVRALTTVDGGEDVSTLNDF